MEDELIKKNDEFEKIKNENKKILQSISLIHDCFITMEEDFKNINNINTKLSNGFEIWIQQQKEIIRNAIEKKNNEITFNDCFISESIKNDVEKLSQNFPKIMKIKKIKSDNNLNNFLQKIIIKQKENSISKKEKNIHDINEFKMNIQIGNLKEKKVENNNNNNETIISLGTIMEQPSREEKDNIHFKSFGNLNQNKELKNNEIIIKENESKKINYAFEKMKKSIEEKNLNVSKKIDNIKVNNTLKTFVNETQIYKQKLENYKNSKNNNSNKSKNENEIKYQILSQDVNKIKDKIYNSINTQNIIINNNNNNFIINEKNIQTPSFANIKPLNYSNNKISKNKSSKQDFTFSKINKNNNLQSQKSQNTKEKSKNNKLIILNNYIESSPMIEEWKNPLSISTNNNLFDNLQLSEYNKNKIDNNNNINNDIKNIYSDIQERDYSISDLSSNDSINDEINPNKFIPEWAKNEKYIEEQIKKQNENENYYKEIFGKFVIEKLNLNMIFETMNEKYNLRHSTADWKYDISNKNNNNIINYQHLNENSNIFPQTNRQLHFSGLKNN